MPYDSPDDYERTRVEIADPAKAIIAACPDCGHRIAYRCWPGGKTPGDEPEILYAFLDGLTQLAEHLPGVDVYGYWMLVGPPDERPPAPDHDLPCELWHGLTRTLVASGRFKDVTYRMMEDHRDERPTLN